MENQKPLNLTLKPLDDTDVTTWKLPEGAIGRLARGRVSDMSFSADGKYLAVATPIGCWLYDRPSLKPLALFETERGMLNTIVFSHDAQLIATSNADGIVKVWDTQTLQCITKIDSRASTLHFSQDGQYLAMSNHRRSAIYSWRTNTDEPILRFPIDAEDTKGHSFPICFSPNGNLLAYVSSIFPQATITISDVDTGEHITDFSCPAPLGFRGLVFSPCGQYLASAHRNGDVQVCNVHNATSEIVHTVSGATSVKLAYTPDGTLHVAEVHKGKVVIWDNVQQDKMDTLEFEGNRAICCFSGDSTQFAIANSREFRVWTADKSIRVMPMPDAHPSIVRWLRFSQKEKTLISGHSGHYTLFWSVVNHQAQRIFRPDTEGYSLGLRSVLSPCEEFLAASVFGSRHNTDIGIVVWHITSGTLIAELTGHEKRVLQMAYSPTGDCLVSGSLSGELYVWDTQQWEKRHKLIGHTDDIRSAVFHPDGKQLVTASHDKTARVWNVENGEQVGSLPLDALLEDASLYKGRSQEIQQFIDWKQKLGTQQPIFLNVGSIKFSPGGTLIAGRLSRERRWKGIANEIRLWDAETLETRMAILLPVDASSTYALAFSSCGRYLASGTWWKKGLEKMSIHLWEVATGENIHTFWGHPTDIHDLAFSPDGKLLASGSYDGTILLWDMKPFINT